MKTAIGHPTYYTLICKKAKILPGHLTTLHLHRGVYFDIRDVMHRIIHYTKMYRDIELIFTIESSNKKPFGWVNPSRYNENCQAPE
jgi:hypothetical protein